MALCFYLQEVAYFPKIIRVARQFMHVGDHKPVGLGLREKVAKFVKNGWRFMQGAPFAEPKVREDAIQAAQTGQASAWESTGIPWKSPPLAGKLRQVTHLGYAIAIPEVKPFEWNQCQILDLNRDPCPGHDDF